jgi:hypothetical protein
MIMDVEKNIEIDTSHMAIMEKDVTVQSPNSIEIISGNSSLVGV